MVRTLIALFLCAAVALGLATVMAKPAHAERADKPAATVTAKTPKAVLPICEVYASTEAPNPDALVEHEEAHCWGWEHPKHRAPKPGETAYRAAPIPLKYRLLGHYPKDKLIIYWVTEKDAYAECGSWGCQYGGLH